MELLSAKEEAAEAEAARPEKTAEEREAALSLSGEEAFLRRSK